MKRSLRNAMLAAFAGFIVGGLVDACDNVGASSSIGACTENVPTCSGLTDSTSCARYQNYGTKEVKEDFPVSCVTKQDYNCNSPLENCYRGAKCQWDGSACVNDPNNNNVWTDMAKRKSELCGEGDPGEM
ncbi:MAG: hypothetical protein KDB03_17365 [Planctomycetales bacterium]|nr:hypothetical protein [Planctomycetales bacterium]